MSKLLSIVTPLFNEEENVAELCSRIQKVMKDSNYQYEHICIDNCSTDNTVNKLKILAENDIRLKIIVNARNFGYIRSSFHAITQSNGDAVILLSSDLQDPPEMIFKFISKWEEGYKSVFAVKPQSEESVIMFTLRKLYYKFITLISDVPLVKNATGAGLFDKIIIDSIKKIEDPYPYFRGLVCEIGYPITTVSFLQPKRKKGKTSQNFFSLYDAAMTGITKHSKIPLRLMTIFGFFISAISLFIAIIYLIAKLIYWNTFVLGTAPLLIGIFFLGALQLFSIGLIGEYIGTILTQVRNLPLVVEKERVNF